MLARSVDGVLPEASKPRTRRRCGVEKPPEADFMADLSADALVDLIICLPLGIEGVIGVEDMMAAACCVTRLVLS